MAKKFTVTNWGVTRRFPWKTDNYEIPRERSIETDDEEMATAFGSYPYVDVTVNGPSDEEVAHKKYQTMKIGKVKLARIKAKAIKKEKVSKKKTVKKKATKKKVGKKNAAKKRKKQTRRK
ncbi:hypothetical protein KAR91_08775 [Candidatus Pacearchaeota archaeon]|nr:hypothetical protein [Candidatus Pacearchaeota archaeon]